MLIRFWFGQVHFGRPSHIGVIGDYDAGVTFCLGRRGYDVPPGELPWRFVCRVVWNWFPNVVYRIEPRSLTRSEIAVNRMVAALSGKEPYSLSSEYARNNEEARWTERVKVIGFGDWRHALTIYRSTRRSKVFVYLTGSKERANPSHILRVCPGATMSANDVPAEFMDGDKPKPFEITFVHGRASVDEQLGKWMIEKGVAQKTNLIRRSGSTLGSLAAAIRGA